jgi:hypothetical protein
MHLDGRVHHVRGDAIDQGGVEQTNTYASPRHPRVTPLVLGPFLVLPPTRFPP